MCDPRVGVWFIIETFRTVAVVTGEILYATDKAQFALNALVSILFLLNIRLE